MNALYRACDPCTRLMGEIPGMTPTIGWRFYERPLDSIPSHLPKNFMLPADCLQCGQPMDPDKLCPCGALYGPRMDVAHELRWARLARKIRMLWRREIASRLV